MKHPYLGEYAVISFHGICYKSPGHPASISLAPIAITKTALSNSVILNNTTDFTDSKVCEEQLQDLISPETIKSLVAKGLEDILMTPLKKNLSSYDDPFPLEY